MPTTHLKSGSSRRSRRSSTRSRAPRAAVRIVFGALLSLLALPAIAAAAPPSLQAPASNAAVVEGKTVTYTWSGDLLGAESTRDQAYFKVEVIDASKVPLGQQTPWPDADTFKQTEPGQTVTSIDLGAPPAGSWKWRICAWGVVDPLVSPTVQQIPNGCSPSRTLTSATAIGDATKEVQIVEDKRHVTVANAPTIIEKVRPSTSRATPASTDPDVDADPVEDELPVEEPILPVKIEKRATVATTAKGARKSSVALSNAGGLGDATAADSAAAKTDGAGDISGALATGLSATIPGIPVPFWVLLFVIACVPIAVVWRRSVLAMFEWSDGSIDGFGTPDSRTAPVLANVHSARDAHAFGGRADDAATTSTTIPEATIPRRAA